MRTIPLLFILKWKIIRKDIKEIWQANYNADVSASKKIFF